MAVTLGQVSLIAALAAAASAKKPTALAAAVLATGLVKLSAGDTVTIPAQSSNGLTKFEPKIPNPNKAMRRKEKCIDLQMKLNLSALNFKIPSLNLALILPKLPTLNLDFLNVELSKEIQCVLEALQLLALIQALLAKQAEEEGGAAGTGTTGAATTGTGTTATTTTTSTGTRSVTFYNPNL